MLEQHQTDLLRASIEEELGTFRAFADLPSTEIEAMAARLTRIVTDLMGQSDMPESRAA